MLCLRPMRDASMKQMLETTRAIQRQCNPRNGLHYHGMEDLLLQHGRDWDLAEFPEKWKSQDYWPKQCFSNAFLLAKRSKGELLYVEGMATGVIPVHHAWCATKDGKVIDPTWGMFRTIGLGSAYFGVAIPLEVVRAARTKENTSALLDWVHDFPLLREPFNHPQPKG